MPLHHVPCERLSQARGGESVTLPGAGSMPSPEELHAEPGRPRVPGPWTHWDLDPGPSACRADVMPLHHVPHGHYLLPVFLYA